MATLDLIPTGGQSLPLGSQGQPRISTASEASNARKVLADGTLVALQETAGSANQRPDLSMGYRIAQHAPSQLYGFSTHALGGNTIAQLSKGGSSGKYEELISFASAATSVQAAGGGTTRVREVHFGQGEADQTFGTAFSVYLAAVAKLYTDLNADIPPITGQSGPIPLIMSQMATWLHYGNPALIGLAQLQAARTLPNVYVVGGQYQLEYYTDGLHLTAPGYYHQGELHARAGISIADGAGWAPFAPTGYVVAGNTITAQFHVPHGPLAFDTTIVPAQTNMGFSLAGTAATIASVAITASDTVTITTTVPVTESTARLGYGVSTGVGGAGAGNLRDSETAVSVYDGKALANWALQFDDSLGIPPTPDESIIQRVDNVYLVGAGGALYEVTPYFL